MNKIGRSTCIFFLIIIFFLSGCYANHSLEKNTKDNSQLDRVSDSRKKVTHTYEEQEEEQSIWKILNKSRQERDQYILSASLGWIGSAGGSSFYGFLTPYLLMLFDESDSNYKHRFTEREKIHWDDVMLLPYYEIVPISRENRLEYFLIVKLNESVNLPYYSKVGLYDQFALYIYDDELYISFYNDNVYSQGYLVRMDKREFFRESFVLVYKLIFEVLDLGYEPH